MFKLIPLLCTHVYSYMFSTVHPPSYNPTSQVKTYVILTYVQVYSCPKHDGC